MQVVSNTSPLIFLSKLGALDLLPLCFDGISIPQAVQEELGEFTLPAFVNMVSISPFGSRLVDGMIGNLHRGELEVMVLAQESRADLVLLDDLAARNKAKRRFGLKIMGTVGVVQLAYAKGHLSRQQAHDYYDELVLQHGLYLSPEILQHLKSL
ncbi:MAG: hypothetical protein RI964_1621 [Pseudomonadota bacterium]|jgi:predicted nucleic acid-binding protein